MRYRPPSTRYAPSLTPEKIAGRRRPKRCQFERDGHPYGVIRFSSPGDSWLRHEEWGSVVRRMLCLGWTITVEPARSWWSALD